MKLLKTIVTLSLVAGLFFIPSIAQSALDDGLVAFYPFNGDANDESGNENHCNVYGAVLSEDRFGSLNSAYSFDGIDDYIEKKNPSDALDIADNSWTISAWIKTTDTDHDKKIIHRYEAGWSGSSTNSGSYALSAMKTNIAYFSVVVGNTEISTGVGDQTQTVNIADGNWHHIVAMLNRELSSLKIYVDGVYKNSNMIDIEGSTPNSGAPLEIGRKFIEGWGSPNGYYLGSIDNIRIYNRALSDDEINELFLINDNVGSISGKIVTDVTGQLTNIMGATITITETNQSIISDNDGIFSFPEVSTGTYTIKIEKNGFETLILNNIIVVKDTDTSLSVINLSFRNCGLKGDFNDDNRIDLTEAIHALQIVSGLND